MRNHTAFSTTTHNRPVLTTTPEPDTYPDGRRRVTMCSARCARNARGARAVDRREQRESSKMMCETSCGVPESKRASCLHAEGKGVNLQHIAAADCTSTFYSWFELKPRHLYEDPHQATPGDFQASNLDNRHLR